MNRRLVLVGALLFGTELGAETSIWDGSADPGDLAGHPDPRGPPTNARPWRGPTIPEVDWNWPVGCVPGEPGAGSPAGDYESL